MADSTREGTRLAVKDAMIGILSNPELRALIAPQSPALTPTRTSVVSVSTIPRWVAREGRRGDGSGQPRRQEAAGLVSNQYRAIRDGLAATACGPRPRWCRSVAFSWFLASERSPE